MNKTKQTRLAVGQEKRSFFAMWPLKSMDFMDRRQGLNYLKGINNYLRPCHLHHGRKLAKLRTLRTIFIKDRKIPNHIFLDYNRSLF